MRALLVLLFMPAIAAAANPLTWYDIATLAGGSGNTITLTWQDSADFPPDRYELIGISIERSKTSQWQIAQSAVTRTPSSDAGKLDVSYTFKLPSSGHYSFQIRSCWNNPASCSDWTNSQDPTVATVNGKARAWWVYVFLEPPGGVISIP